MPSRNNFEGGGAKQARRSTVQLETKIAYRRVGCAITQRQAAKAAGMSYWTYRRLEAADLKDPGIRLVVNVALALPWAGEPFWETVHSLWEDHWPRRPNGGLTWSLGVSPKEKVTRLRHYRDETEMSQEAVAESLGISSRAYRDLERGRIWNPRLSLLVLAADSFDLPLEEVCEPEWLAWTRFGTAGAKGPGDLSKLKEGAEPFLLPRWAAPIASD